MLKRRITIRSLMQYVALPHFPRPRLTGAQTANWGWYYNLDQTCDN
jgi:hypothetical protein